MTRLNALSLACSAAFCLGAATIPTYAAIPTPDAHIIIAKHGADDKVPQPDPGCDDNGTDVCNAMTILSKHGADDKVPQPDPGCDDNGTDACMIGAPAQRQGLMAREGSERPRGHDGRRARR